MTRVSRVFVMPYAPSKAETLVPEMKIFDIVYTRGLTVINGNMRDSSTLHEKLRRASGVCTISDSAGDSTRRSLTQRKLIGDKQDSLRPFTFASSHTVESPVCHPTALERNFPNDHAIVMSHPHKRVKRGDDYIPRPSLVPAYDPTSYSLLGPAYDLSYLPL